MTRNREAGPREAGERVVRVNYDVADLVEADWQGMSLSLIRYRRLEESNIHAVNKGLLLSLCVDGDAQAPRLRVNGSAHAGTPTPPGAFHMLPPDTLFESAAPPSLRHLTYLNVVLPTHLIEEMAEDFKFAALHPQFNYDDPFVASLLQQIFRVVRTGEASPLYQEAASRFLLATLLQSSRTTTPRSACGGLAGWQLKRTTDYLLAHLADEISLAELAALVDLSPYHFCRAFKQSTGLPPHAWLCARRIERAQELMIAHPAMGLIEVALCVGYESQAAFGVAFKRTTGVTPGRWRREVER